MKKILCVTLIFAVLILMSYAAFAQESVSKKEALDALLDAEDEIREMQSFNLTTILVSDMLSKAKLFYIGDNANFILDDIEKEEDLFRKKYLESLLAVAETTPKFAIEKQDFLELVRTVEEIKITKQFAYSVLDTISIVKEKESQYNVLGVNTLNAQDLIKEAEKAFSENRYEDAKSYIERVNLMLDESQKEFEREQRILFLSSSFIERNWLYILISIAIILIISVPSFKIYNRKRLKIKISDLEIEKNKLTELIKQAQEERFNKKTLSKLTYDIRVDRYQKRMAEITRTLPVLRSLLKGRKKDKTIIRK